MDPGSALELSYVYNVKLYWNNFFSCTLLTTSLLCRVLILYNFVVQGPTLSWPGLRPWKWWWRTTGRWTSRWNYTTPAQSLPPKNIHQMYLYIYLDSTHSYIVIFQIVPSSIYTMFCSCRVRQFGAGSLRTANMTSRAPRGRLAATHPTDRKISAAGVIFLASTAHLLRELYLSSNLISWKPLSAKYTQLDEGKCDLGRTFALASIFQPFGLLLQVWRGRVPNFLNKFKRLIDVLYCCSNNSF